MFCAEKQLPLRHGQISIRRDLRIDLFATDTKKHWQKNNEED